MTEDANRYWFKGDNLINLCKIDILLTTKSPLHIGTGQTRPDTMVEKNENDAPPQIAVIDRDYRNLPFISGSALRGVIRNYLFHIFGALDNNIAQEPDFNSEKKFRDMKQADQIKYMKTEASLLEQLFGTPFCESKIECWDALQSKIVKNPSYGEKGWDSEMQTYTIRSVAIDNITGASATNKLYSFDVVPVGMEYKFSIVGRNLSDQELGFLLIGLEGFNSPIYPLTVGAMSNRGFGRMNMKIQGLYRLERENISNWINLTSTRGDAGYGLLNHLEIYEDEQKLLINSFKSSFISLLKEKK